MVTCYLRYEIDYRKVAEFERYSRFWITLIERFGGAHHGCFLPHEGPSNVAVTLFSFPSLAEYEQYRIASQTDPDCLASWEYLRAHKIVYSVDRSFMRPVFEGLDSLDDDRAFD